MKHIWSGFGYELWQDEMLENLGEASYIIVNGEGEQVGPRDGEGLVYNCSTTFEAKKWMKEHKTSVCWCADGTWDWSREKMV